MLYEHQKEAIKLLIRNEKFALYHEQGLGKTITSIIAADFCLKTDPQNYDEIRVICPAFLQQNWFQEIKKWSKFPNKYKVFSYEKFSNLVTSNQQCSFFIVDEAHYIKNRRAKRTDAVANAVIRAKRAVLLTGTPIGNGSILDLYTHLVCLNHKHEYANYRAFYNQFVEHKQHKFDKPKPKNVEQFMRILEPYTQRKTKMECLDLPPKTYKTIMCKGSKAPKHLHVSHKMQLQEGFPVDVQIKDDDTVLDIVRYESSSKKLETLSQIIDCLAPKTQVVIYVAFIKSLEYISRELKKEKITHECFSGQLSEGQKNLMLSNFKNGKFRILIATMQSLNVGVTLTNCCNVIYYSRTFSCTERAQSEDRFHRIGQHNVVEYIDIVSEGIDERAFELIKQNKSIDEIQAELEKL